MIPILVRQALGEARGQALGRYEVEGTPGGPDMRASVRSEPTRRS
jgi:hypothetical protein